MKECTQQKPDKTSETEPQTKTTKYDDPQYPPGFEPVSQSAAPAIASAPAPVIASAVAEGHALLEATPFLQETKTGGPTLKEKKQKRHKKHTISETMELQAGLGGDTEQVKAAKEGMAVDPRTGAETGQKTPRGSASILGKRGERGSVLANGLGSEEEVVSADLYKNQKGADKEEEVDTGEAGGMEATGLGDAGLLVDANGGVHQKP